MALVLAVGDKARRLANEALLRCRRHARVALSTLADGRVIHRLAVVFVDRQRLARNRRLVDRTDGRSCTGAWSSFPV